MLVSPGKNTSAGHCKYGALDDHLDLAFATLWDLNLIESNILLAMESERFHHLDYCQGDVNVNLQYSRKSMAPGDQAQAISKTSHATRHFSISLCRPMSFNPAVRRRGSSGNPSAPFCTAAIFIVGMKQHGPMGDEVSLMPAMRFDPVRAMF